MCVLYFTCYCIYHTSAVNYDSAMLFTLISDFSAFKEIYVCMKYVVLLCDGMADYPIESLGGKTPLEAAHTPCMDFLAQTSEVGLVKTVDDSLPPGSDVANLSVMGYDPTLCYTGRSPIEAAGMGINMSDTDVAMRCNLVTLSDDEPFGEKTMVDYCAGDISTEEAHELIKALNDRFGSDEFKFYPGVSYRHCLMWHSGKADIGTLTPPHDISGQKIGEHLNTGKDAEKLLDMCIKSGEVLKNHPVNLNRMAKGLKPANSIWLWGQGTKPKIENFYKKNGIHGAVVTAVDLLKGIAKCAGMSIGKVEGATGYIDTDFEGKADAALLELENGADYVYVHVEAPDECGHRGELENKIKAIEMIDSRLLKRLLDGLKIYDDYHLLIMPDHPTPISTRTHARDAVPYLLYRKNMPALGVHRFSEAAAKESGILISPGCDILKRLIDKDEDPDNNN